MKSKNYTDIGLLRPKGIKEGMVAYFDTDQINKDKRIIKNFMSNKLGMRPFVCVESTWFHSVWVAITSCHRDERLFIKPEWRLWGSPRWRIEECYLSDGGSTFVGPNQAFVDAAYKEDMKSPFHRPFITPKGMKHILAVVEERAGMRLATYQNILDSRRGKKAA